MFVNLYQLWKLTFFVCASSRHNSADVYPKFDTSNADWIDRLLHCAAKFDWPDLIARHLVVAPGFRPAKVKSAFRRACAHGSVGVVNLFLDIGPSPAAAGAPKYCSVSDPGGTDGKTGLHIACHHGRPRVVEELLARASRYTVDHPYFAIADIQR
jgi:hypothetical protein